MELGGNTSKDIQKPFVRVCYRFLPRFFFLLKSLLAGGSRLYPKFEKWVPSAKSLRTTVLGINLWIYEPLTI